VELLYLWERNSGHNIISKMESTLRIAHRQAWDW